MLVASFVTLLSFAALAAATRSTTLVSLQCSPVCGYNQAAQWNGTCLPCAVLQYPNGTSCASYGSLSQKMAGDFAATRDSGDTAWMLAGSALVMIMTPALALFYGGLSTEGNVMNTMMLSVMCVAIITVEWALFGYSLAFGPGGYFIGSFEWGSLVHITTLPSAVYATTVPHKIFVAFQCMFAQITPALISGAIVGRMTFVSFCVFIMMWHAVVYCPLAHLMWSRTLDANGNIVPAGLWAQLGAIDFAGGTVVHCSSGFAALAASLVVGSRLMKKDSRIDITKLLSGAGLLWFGWFGFNAGSANTADAIAANAFLATHVSAASSAIAWVVCEYVHQRKASAVGVCCAIVIGLVAVTPACGYVAVHSAIAIGGCASAICYAANLFKVRYASQYLDDTLDVFLCHGLAGFAGTILTGVFADNGINSYSGAINGNGIRVAVQLMAATFAATYSFVASALILLALKYTIGIRVTEEQEIEGLDRVHENVDVRDNSCAPTDEDEPFVVVFTDIEKSTKLWAKDAHGMTRAMAMHQDVVRRLVKRHGLYEVKTFGDTCMIVGSNVASAVRFATELQAELQRADWSTLAFIDDVYNHQGSGKGSDSAPGTTRSTISTYRTYGPPPTDRSSFNRAQQAKAAATTVPVAMLNGLRVRVGIHFGYGSVQFDTNVKGYDYYGMVVNTAGRIEGMGHGGQVLISEEAWTEAKRQDPSVVDGVLPCTILGTQRLEGMTELLSVVQVLPLALAARRFPPLRVGRDRRRDRSMSGRGALQEAKGHPANNDSSPQRNGAATTAAEASRQQHQLHASSFFDDDRSDTSSLMAYAPATPTRRSIFPTAAAAGADTLDGDAASVDSTPLPQQVPGAPTEPPS